MSNLSDADKLVVATLAAAVIRNEGGAVVARAVKIFDLVAEEFAKDPQRLSAKKHPFSSH